MVLFVLVGIATVASCMPNHVEVPALLKSESLPAGALTAKRVSSRSFVEPGASLSAQQKLQFWTGFSLFRDPWVIAPSSTSDRDGLGPLFVTRSCISCHLAGARGNPPQEGISKPSALVIRFGPDTSVADFAEWKNTAYGDQLHPRAISITTDKVKHPLKAEGKLHLTYKDIKGTFNDGTEYTLKAPQYALTDLAYGPVQHGTAISPRFAPPIYGMGLIDAISESDLLVQEDANDSNDDGISARYNNVLNVKTNEYEVGRFGWKAKHPNLLQQVAAAFRDDIGITSGFFPDESCTAAQSECKELAKLSLTSGANKEEIPDNLLSLVDSVTRYMAVPPARNLSSKQAQAGRALFYQAQCAACHTPRYKTPDDALDPALVGQVIYPYSNFALHDMGEGLADGVNEFKASGREWRTPPLWGIGLQKQYKRDARFLHDGRASTIQEAILWHGGEALASQQHFINMSQAERASLLAFLNAI